MLARYEPHSRSSRFIRLLIREYYKKGCVQMFTQMANWSSDEVFRVPQFAKSASKYINYERLALGLLVLLIRCFHIPCFPWSVVPGKNHKV